MRNKSCSYRRLHRHVRAGIVVLWMSLVFFFTPLCCRVATAQMDQGTITGLVEDSFGAIIPNASVTLTNTDIGLVLQTKSDGSGFYNFSPIKIGHYSVSASAPGFATTTQEKIQLNLQERLNVVLNLHPGNVTESVTVTSAPPLLQSQEGSVAQVISTQTINNTPLNGRNWVYIAQLTAGADPGTGGRGAGTGDFDANGQRVTQNNFILDGIDNNTNTVDFLNGASYVVRPPPDALAEFKMETGDYSAEFGHSAGAVVNASIKSGTNQIHGDLWEYNRNTVLDAQNWNATNNPPYHENQFGATLGGPILKNKLFFFGDAEANRIIYDTPTIETVPTALMRQGNFSELLNTSLTGEAKPVQLYEPNSGGTATLECNSANNVFCASQIDTVAQTILKMYPLPNTNGGDTYNNYNVNLADSDNTWQWDTRMDWNLSARDQIFGRFSYENEVKYFAPPLGSILDGGPSDGSGNVSNLGQNFALSETHIFNPTLVNEFRIGYNYAHFTALGPTPLDDIASTYGFGGVPFSPGYFNGGLPYTNISPESRFGTANATPSIEHENVYQILDNLTKTFGKHSLKFGLDLQSIRFATVQESYVHGEYTFSGLFTSDLNASFTGSGVADFLADQMDSAEIATLSTINDARWYRAAYVQDDWRANSRLTLNMGLRYDYTQPLQEMAGRQANFLPEGGLGPGTGSGVYEIPTKGQGVAIAPAFTNVLAQENITLEYVNNPFLVAAQKANFAPRFGISYSVNPRTVIRGGFGLFYGGLENVGAADNLGRNYPFQFTDSFTAPTCKAGYGNCQNVGLTLENGFSTAIAEGLQNFVSQPLLNTVSTPLKTAYSMEENFAVERDFGNNLALTVGYVGTVGRHLLVVLNTNGAEALINPSRAVSAVFAFPELGTCDYQTGAGISSYNALQTKLEKRYSHGLDFLATYTWSHSLDDAVDILSQNNTAYTDTALVPIRDQYSNSIFDTRQRFTMNGFYDLPFGEGRAHMNRGGIVNLLGGGWSTSLTFAAQTGEPFTVTPNITAAGGISARAVKVRNPFTAGGQPDPSNSAISCAAHTRTRTNWYNPCAFANPLPGSDIPTSGTGSEVTNLAQVLQYVGGNMDTVEGPGYERINMSVFKDFPTFREERLEFRSDVFNLFNTPSYGSPSVTTDNTSGGEITTTRTFQNFTPDARFFQLSLKYMF